MTKSIKKKWFLTVALLLPLLFLLAGCAKRTDDEATQESDTSALQEVTSEESVKGSREDSTKDSQGATSEEITGGSSEGTSEESSTAAAQEESEDKGYIQISQEEAAEMMKRDDGHVIVDVRRPDEYKEGHIVGAINVQNEYILDEPPKSLPDKDQILLVYCRSGRRSKEAAEKLAKLGYTHVYEFGGIITWTGEVETGR